MPIKIFYRMQSGCLILDTISAIKKVSDLAKNDKAKSIKE
jgi:hypothetical protein